MAKTNEQVELHLAPEALAAMQALQGVLDTFPLPPHGPALVGLQVWKYQLNVLSGPQPVLMPAGAAVVYVGAQDGKPTLWALVRPGNPRARRMFLVAPTGSPLPGQVQRYVGTVQLPPFVWHIFECEEANGRAEEPAENGG